MSGRVRSLRQLLRTRGLLVAAVVVLVAGALASVLVGGGGDGGGDDLASVDVTQLPRTTSSSTSSTSSTTTTAAVPTTLAPTTTVEPPTTAPPPPTSVVAEAAAAGARPFTVAPYTGLGAWVDVFDWTATYDRTPEDPPAVGLPEIDRMADLGVRTLYVQLARWDSPAPGVVEIDAALAMIDRAHLRGLSVVGWYLPTLVDPAHDRNQIEAVLDLPIDGFGLDIESTAVPDEAERNARVVQLSADIRAAHPDEAMSAIVLPPVVTEVYGTYWGSFPWVELAPYFDVWQPMGYWTMRARDSGWRDPYTYTAANIDLLREATGLPGAIVHPVGGIGSGEGVRPYEPPTPADIAGMIQAAAERGAPGASIYDYATTGDDLWAALQGANGL